MPTSKLWGVESPRAWPAPPAEMSYSALRDIEACPRRWALGAATYPELWDRPGYPPRVTLAALPGVVVHQAVEEIAKAFVGNDCADVSDPRTIAVMKELGGYSGVLARAIDRSLTVHVGNPRATEQLGSFSATLRSRIPELRARVQTLLARTRLTTSPQRSAWRTEGGPAAGGGPLANGTYPELSLRARSIRWKGRVDLLLLDGSRCSITDYKTGERDDDHAFQLRAYALLWARDGERNPDGRLATELKLSYIAGDVEVPPPTSDELSKLEAELTSRTRQSHADLAARPPPARPTPSNCRYCAVRQMCGEYWDSIRANPSLDESARFVDVEVMIEGRHGPSSLSGVVRRAPAGVALGPVAVRATRELPILDRVTLRLVGAHLVQPEEGDSGPHVLTIGALTEVFAV